MPRRRRRRRAHAYCAECLRFELSREDAVEQPLAACMARLVGVECCGCGTRWGRRRVLFFLVLGWSDWQWCTTDTCGARRLAAEVGVDLEVWGWAFAPPP